MYTFSSIGDYSIPKSVKCTHAATKLFKAPSNFSCKLYSPLAVEISAWPSAAGGPHRPLHRAMRSWGVGWIEKGGGVDLMCGSILGSLCDEDGLFRRVLGSLDQTAMATVSAMGWGRRAKSPNHQRGRHFWDVGGRDSRFAQCNLNDAHTETYPQNRTRGKP